MGCLVGALCESLIEPVQHGVDVRSDAIVTSDASRTGPRPLSRRLNFAIAVATFSLLGPLSWPVENTRAQTPTPTTQIAATAPVSSFPVGSPFRRYFNQLTDPDPKVRDQARQDLMGIKGEDLPKLRQLVVDHLPISPDQTAALRDIVRQAYLASEKYDIPGGASTDPSGSDGPFFLGLMWGIELDAADTRLGVTVDERLPGFPSYRFLRKGDMILGIWIHPDTPLPKQPDWLTPNRQALISAISSSPRSQDIVLQLIRNGQVITVPIKMAPKPLDADPTHPESLQTFKALRAERAETYWQENFAPLFEK